MENLEECIKNAKISAKRCGFDAHIIKSIGQAPDGSKIVYYGFTHTPKEYHPMGPNEVFIRTIPSS